MHYNKPHLTSAASLALVKGCSTISMEEATHWAHLEAGQSDTEDNPRQETSGQYCAQSAMTTTKRTKIRNMQLTKQTKIYYRKERKTKIYQQEDHHSCHQLIGPDKSKKILISLFISKNKSSWP